MVGQGGREEKEEEEEEGGKDEEEVEDSRKGGEIDDPGTLGWPGWSTGVRCWPSFI